MKDLKANTGRFNQINAGKIGVNTPVPTSDLHITGTTHVDGTLSVGDAVALASSGAVGGTTPTVVGQTIVWDGSKWIVGNNNSSGSETREVPSAFVAGLVSGQSVHTINFQETYTTPPAVSTDLQVTGTDPIIPYVITDVSNSAMTVVFAKALPSSDYKLHITFGGKDVYWDQGSLDKLTYSDGDVNISNNLEVGGNLTIGGETMTVNTTEMTIEDHNITIASNNPSSALTGPVLGGAGITWGNDNATRLVYNHGSGFQFIGAGLQANEQFTLMSDVTNPPLSAVTYQDLQSLPMLLKDSSLHNIDGTIVTGIGFGYLGETTSGIVVTDRGGSQAQSINFITGVTDNVHNRLTVDWNGNIGIGTQTPTDRLSIVDGNVSIGLETAASGVLEVNTWGEKAPGTGSVTNGNMTVPTTEDLTGIIEAGDVIRMANDNSTSDMSTKEHTVIGVNSSPPSITLSKPADYTATLHIFKKKTTLCARSGRLGIGVIPTTGRLHVVGTTGAKGGVVLGGRLDDDTSLTTMRFFHDTDDTTHISRGNAEAISITSDRKVGIGTTSPGAKLDISTNDTTGLRLINTDSAQANQSYDPPAILFQANGWDTHVGSRAYSARIRVNSNYSGAPGRGNTHPVMNFDLETNENNPDDTLSTKMMINADGNVGIGTTTPGYTLEVAKDVDSWVSRIYNTGSDVNAAGMLVRTDANAAHNTHAFSVYADSGYKFSVRSGGNVGIGTSMPQSELHIESNKADHDTTLKIENRHGDTGGTAIEFQGYRDVDDDHWVAKIVADHVSSTAHGSNAIGSRLNFHTYDGLAGYSSPKMTIDQDGTISTNNVPDPQGTVHFTKSGGGTDNRQRQYNTTFDSNETSGWCSLVAANASTGTIGVFTNQRSAVLGTAANNSYGNTDMFGLLYLQKESGSNTYLWVDNSQNWRTSTSFTYTGSDAGGTVVGTQTSDERLKDISLNFNYGLEHVLQLQPITYTRKDDIKPTQRLGFGAQTTQQIIPETVYDTGECVDGYVTDPEDETKDTPNSDETILAMEYVQLIPVLTKAIQEQQTIIESQQSKIDGLIARIETLENK